MNFIARNVLILFSVHVETGSESGTCVGLLPLLPKVPIVLRDVPTLNLCLGEQRSCKGNQVEGIQNVHILLGSGTQELITRII